MITFEEIQKEWEKDSPIDITNLAAESARIPIMHAKYMSYLNQFKISLRKKENAFINLKRDKERYYRGEMTREELQKYGWQQYQLRVAKSELQHIISMDVDIMRAADAVFAFEIVVDYIKEVIKQINNRSFAVRDAIEWTKFSNGLN